MAGNVEELILRITGDSASGEQAIRRVQRAWSELGRYLERSTGQIRGAAEEMSRAGDSARKLQERLDQVGKAGKFLGVVFGGLSAAGGKLIQTTARVAMRNEVLALSLHTVGENAGYGSDELDMLVDRVKSMGITTSQATLGVTRMIQGQLDLAKATDTARVSQDLAVIAGENSSETYGNIMESVNALQPRLLRQYGIVATVDQILGDLSNSTDVAAKRNRFLQFVLDEGARVAGVYEGAMGLVGKRITSIPRLVEEVQAAFGKHFLPIIGKAVDFVSKLLKTFQAMPEGAQRVVATLILVGTGLGVVGAAIGALLAVVPMLISGWTALSGLLAPLAPALASILPIALAVGAALGTLAIAGSVLAKAWREDWGGIRTAVEGAWATIKPLLEKLMALARTWGEHFGLQIRRIIASVKALFGIRDSLEPLFEQITQLIRSIDWSGLFATLGDALNVAGNLISSFLDTINRLLRGEGTRAFGSLREAAVDGLTLVALVFDRYVKNALTWGWNLIVQVANGISKAAQSVLVRVMQAVGGVIGRFLAPGSPPQEGPLSNIAKWGQGVMDTFLRAFGLADFGLLRDALGPIQSALESAVQAGEIDESEFVEVFGRVREQAAELVATFRQTGEISEEVLGRIAETLGEGSEEYVKFLRLQLEHQRALENLEDVQSEVAEAEARGFIPKALKDKLKAAEGAAAAAEEEMNWQREYLAMQQESVDLQARMVQVLDELGSALDSIASAGTGVEGVGLTEALGLGELGEAAAGLDAVRAQLGEMSPEFERMRQRVVDFLALPLAGKLMTIAQYLSNVTGIDFVGFLEDVIAVIERIDEEGLLDVIKGWIGQGIDYVQDNWEKWAESVSGYLMDMFVRAVAYLMEEVEEAEVALTTWVGEVIARLLMWMHARREEWGQALKNRFGAAWNSFIAKLRAGIMTYANQLGNWMRSVISSFIGRVLSKMSQWLDGLKQVGAKIVDKIKSGVAEAWGVLVGYLGGKLAGVTEHITGGGWLNSLIGVGIAIVEMIKKGISHAWGSFINWLIGKLNNIFDLLPWSEPRDPRSPLRNLADSGRALVENFAAGIDFTPVAQGLRMELGRVELAMAGAGGAVGGTTLTQQFGDVVFPNVRDGRDALGVRRGLQELALEASMVGRIGSR